jgi:hypothetical protein
MMSYDKTGWIMENIQRKGRVIQMMSALSHSIVMRYIHQLQNMDSSSHSQTVLPQRVLGDHRNITYPR